jgi:predicted AAA+ superfamily ATPase
MKKIIRRLFSLNLPPGKSAFLWGPRKVGKSYWIAHNLERAIIVDLLKTDLFAEYASRPSLLRERFQDPGTLIVIDEIQKVPSLLDEVHWLMENRKLSFLMASSSARKLRRGHANLLAGRAWRKVMVPLSVRETEGFDLEAVMVSGLLPPHFLSPAPEEDLRAYVADYLKDEIATEALTRNIPAFAEFLKVAALVSGELINYVHVGREAGVSHRVVRTYLDILEDTHLGFRIPPWKKSKKRRLIETEKFYLFDVGVRNYLSRQTPRIGSPAFGKSFEHYLLSELMAFKAYARPDLDVAFWRTSSGFEVDFILGDRELALEIKGSKRVHEGDERGLRALLEDGPVKHAVIACLEKRPRRLERGIEVVPWSMFIDRLWSGDYL